MIAMWYNQLTKCTCDDETSRCATKALGGASMDKIVSHASGVYQLCNTQNNKIYVGSAVNLHLRSSSHFSALNRGDHCSHHLQRSFNKYGAEYFTFSVLEYCEKERLIEREQFYIDLLKPEFNILPTAGSCLGAKRTNETKARMSVAQKGKIISQSCREKISASLTGIKQSDETKRKRANSLQKPVAQYSRGGVFIQTFESLRKAAKAVGVVNSRITGCCKKWVGNKTTGGYLWRYFDGSTGNIEPLGAVYHPNRRVNVSQYSKEGAYIATYKGIEEAGKSVGVNPSHISSCCRGTRETTGGFVWKYASEAR